MKSILILGDCHSNGDNCWDHVIRNNPDLFNEWSLTSYGQHEDLLEWYEKNTTKTLVDKSQMLKSALEYLSQQEKSVAWPVHLQNDYIIFNNSKNGNHCGRYLIQLKDHINKYGKPDLILISNYHWSRVFNEFTVDNQLYNFLSSVLVLELEWTEELGYSKKVLEKRKQEFINDNSKGPNFLREKTNKYHDELIKEIKQRNIPFAHCLFDNNVFTSIDKHIDLTHISSKYWKFNDTENDMIGQNRSYRKKKIKKLRDKGYHNQDLNCTSLGIRVHSKIKFESQKTIADLVRPFIEDCFKVF